jgi:4'-phosphopantetheinyl transferase
MSEPVPIRWPVPAEFPAFSPAGIHLWCARLDDLPSDDRLLSADERMRARAYHFESDRRRFIAARTILRRVLGGYLEQDPAALVFQYGRFGKPALAHPGAGSGLFHPVTNDLAFNQSHAGPLWLLVVSPGRPVGVDVEEIKDLSELYLVEDRIFNPEEIAAQRSLPPLERRQEFFRRWTQREAMAKLHGVGLDLPPGADGGADGPSQLIALELAAGFACTLAYTGAPVRLRQFQWTEAVRSRSAGRLVEPALRAG